MFRRKLTTLGYPRCNEFDAQDDDQFKKLIIWLEDQKIRHYKIENRKKLKEIQSKSWQKSFSDYLNELCCPYAPTERQIVTDWLLGYAVRLEYGDNVKEYQTVRGTKTTEPTSPTTIHNITDSDPQFKNGVRNLAKVLSIPLHEDDKVTLTAVVLLVEERLSQSNLANAKDKHKNNVVPLQKQELGFDTGDETLNNAARALRLLHINELRKLQTDINNAIVSVQTLTANPKTDQRLGKVGRS